MFLKGKDLLTEHKLLNVIKILINNDNKNFLFIQLSDRMEKKD
jgi:hypothetical protein